MTTMLDKAARALKLELYEQEDKARRARKRASIDTHALVRAVLEAIREPGECVLQNFRHDPAWSPSMWPEGIDAILNEKTP